MPKVNLPKKSQKAFSSEVNILRSGKTPVLTREQEQTLRDDRAALNGIRSRLKQAAESIVLLIASTKHSNPEFKILQSVRQEVFSAKTMVATHVTDLDARLERQQLAKSFALAKELQSKEQEAKAASARVLRDHNKKLHATNLQTRLVLREGDGGPSWAISRPPRRGGNAPTHDLPIPEPRLKPYKRRGLYTSTPTTSSTASATTTPVTTSSTSSASSGAPRKAKAYASRIGRRRSPRLQERRQKEEANDAALIKRFGLKRLSVVVERLPNKTFKIKQEPQSEPLPTQVLTTPPPPIKQQPPTPKRAESPTPGPSVAAPILEDVLDDVFAQVEADLKEIMPEGLNPWSFDVEASGYVPVTSPPAIPSPNIYQVERSDGNIHVFDMDESPIAQVRKLEANPIVPPTPDVAHQHVAAAQPVIGVVSPLPVISAADTTHSRQWPLIILDNDDNNREIEIITID